jgi:hypothetical protein
MHFLGVFDVIENIGSQVDLTRSKDLLKLHKSKACIEGFSVKSCFFSLTRIQRTKMPSDATSLLLLLLQRKRQSLRPGSLSPSSFLRNDTRQCTDTRYHPIVVDLILLWRTTWIWQDERRQTWNNRSMSERARELRVTSKWPGALVTTLPG